MFALGPFIYRAALALSLCSVVTPTSTSNAQVAPALIDLNVQTIALDPTDPSLTKVGDLVFKGGLHLSSSDPRFGGFSGLILSADGARMTSISDTGMTFTASLEHDEDGRLIGLADAQLAALPGMDGAPISGKRWADAEAISPGAPGEWLISFERNHRIWRYDADLTSPIAFSPPENMADLASNNGIEALTRLPDGRILAIAEGKANTASSKAWLSRATGWDAMQYSKSDGFRPTGATTLASGDVLVLERFFTRRDGVGIRIQRIPLDRFDMSAPIEGIMLAELRPPLNIDNFEGIDAVAVEDQRASIYVISDDNFNDTQRTILLMFEWQR